MNHDDKLALEKLIDVHGLHGVLVAMSDICHEKADHLVTDWQDPQAGRNWTRWGERLSKLGTVDDPV